jgi:hypothetical protein
MLELRQRLTTQLQVAIRVQVRDGEQSVGCLSHSGNDYRRRRAEVLRNDGGDALNCFGGLH